MKLLFDKGKQISNFDSLNNFSSSAFADISIFDIDFLKVKVKSPVS